MLWRRLLREHTTLVVLVVLCVGLSVRTIALQHPSGAAGGKQLARQIAALAPQGAAVLIVVRDTAEDAAFAAAAQELLEASGSRVVEIVRGQPADARRT